MNKVSRTRSVEYKITFLDRRNETYIYIGAMWAGRIMHDHVSYLHKVEKYAVFLQLPGMWGPVARGDTLSLAKFAATEAITRWLGNFTETPEPPPETLVKALARQDKTIGVKANVEPQRVRRTRAAPPEPVVVRRVSRRR